MLEYTSQKLLPHQQRVVNSNPRKAILNHEMRTGKSLIACHWVDHPCRAGNTYIITPKANKQDWVRAGTRAKVLTKEEFKKEAPRIIFPTAIVVDEAHYFASALFIKGRSQMAGALYELLRDNPHCDVLLLTATPVRNNAWSLHTLLCYIGVYYDWKWWRSEFFSLEQRPFLQFPAWLPNYHWRAQLKPYVERHTDIVSLKDIVEYLPPAESTVIKTKPPKPYEEPEDEIVTWTDEHKHEQQGKESIILSLGYRKLIIVAHYTYQIDELAEKLSSDKPVFILDGRTKDADEVKRLAQEADECYFIVQASMGFGFDGYMFGAIVFASMSHSCVHHTQMLGRLRHMKHLQPVMYYFLLGGRWDQRIYNTIMEGHEFNPHNYLGKE